MDDSYCRVCGRSQTGAGADGADGARDGGGWPSAVDTIAVAAAARLAEAPVLIAASGSGEHGSARRSWLVLGGVAATGVLLVLAATVGFVLFTRDSGPSFAERVGMIMGPVVAADSDLAAKLQTADTPDQLRPVSLAAGVTRQTIVQAQGALTVVDASGRNAAAKALLDQALVANLGYVDRVAAATVDLSTVRASAAATAGQQAAESFAALAATPKMALPVSSAFLSASQLQSLATDNEELAARRVATARGDAALYSIGGSVSGLLGTAVLQDDSESLSVSGNGSFVFGAPVADGSAYEVSVSSSPAGQICTVSNGSGTVSSADVTDVAVACGDDGGGTPGIEVDYQGTDANGISTHHVTSADNGPGAQVLRVLAPINPARGVPTTSSTSSRSKREQPRPTGTDWKLCARSMRRTVQPDDNRAVIWDRVLVCGQPQRSRSPI